MERYEKYKDSGINWLGKIPENWKYGTLKRLATRIVVGIAEAATHAYVNEGIPILRATNIRENKIIGNILHVSADYSRGRESKLIYSCDLVTVRTGNAGVTALIPQELDKCQCFTMLITTLKENVSNRFYCYFLNSQSAKIYFSIEGWGTAQINISVPILQNLSIPIPPPQEQKAIARYLDRKTAEIDKLIAQKERLIELYEEEKTAIINQAVTKGINPDVKSKPSGIDWLVDIPEHWEVKRIKHLGLIKYGLGQPPKEKLDGLPLIRATNVFRGRIDDKNMVYVDPEDIPYERDPALKEHDIIVVRSVAYTADSAIILKQYQGSIAGYDMVFRAYKNYSPKLISYCFLSHYILKNQLLFHSLRAAQPHLNREELGETFIVMPKNIEEQKAIANYTKT